MGLVPMKSQASVSYDTPEQFCAALVNALQGETVKAIVIDGDYYRIEFGSGHKVYIDHRLDVLYLSVPKPL